MIEIESDNVIKLKGRLDEENVSEIEEQLLEVVKLKDNLVVDLNDLDILDISGIFMLFVCKMKAKSQSKRVIYLLNNEKVISGNFLGINLPKII